MTVDEKQWYISRMDIAHETTYDELQLSKEGFTKSREDVISSIKEKRNSVLSAVVFAYIILQGLNQAQWLDRVLFLYILIADIIIGLITFILASRYIRTNYHAFTWVENAIVRAGENLNHNYGFLLKQTSDLSKIGLDRLKIYFEFIPILSAIVLIPISIAMKTTSKFRLLDSYYKEFFANGADGFEKMIDKAIPMFDQLDKQNMPQELLSDVMDTISTYKKESKKIEVKPS